MNILKNFINKSFISNSTFNLNYQNYEVLGSELKIQYSENKPFNHVVIDNFLPKKLCEYLLKKVPDPKNSLWKNTIGSDEINQPNKLGMFHIKNLYDYDSQLATVFQVFNSFAIINFLHKLTDFKALIPDPTFSGGGYHQILRDGRLKIHADFNWHENLKVYRRINLLLYLNKDWKDEYQGNLELWDKDMQHCVKSIKPIFNRCVIFNTGKYSYHGHPIPLKCPENISRKSIATYYYESVPGPDDQSHHSTLWKEN
tara:strand:+ start:677 stop:1444 length:768 start_codon:yes stop_codon:yes gene_type:complete